MDKSHSSSVRIAVADDDAAVRATFVQLLVALGHQVVCSAANGKELLDGCAHGDVDLVFADFHMPIMDGLEAAEHLAASGIPVVLISGHPDAEAIVVDHEPVELVIRKPVSLTTLQVAIGSALRRRQSSTSLSDESATLRRDSAD